MDALQNETQWANLQAFKAVADLGSIGQASSALGVTHNTLRKRVDELEAWVNYPLFSRTNTGSELTPAGEEIYKIVVGIGRLVKSIKLTPNPTNDVPAGIVKFHVENCLAPHLIAPRISEFLGNYPEIQLLLTSADQSADPGTSDIDVSLTIDAPASGEAVAKKVAVIDYTFFASDEYLQRCGTPSSLLDLLKHNTLNLVQYIPYLKALVPELEHAMSEAKHALQTDDMISLVEVTVTGGGISLLPSYYDQLYPNLRPIEGLSAIPVDLLMVYHVKSKERASIRALTDWIKGVFEDDEINHSVPNWTPALALNM